MSFLSLVGPALRMFSDKVITPLANSSDKNPKMSSFLTVLTAVGGYLGIDPGKLVDIGSVFIYIGNTFQNLGMK